MTLANARTSPSTVASWKRRSARSSSTTTALRFAMRWGSKTVGTVGLVVCHCLPLFSFNPLPPTQCLFLMTVADIKHLIDKVWAAKSAISQQTEMFHLTLTRWRIDEELSPWNCILLTKDEASAHESVADVDETYGNALLSRMRQKHLQARVLFGELKNKVAQAHATAR
eukprot:m.43885 g.43885  ORF g.43885 m.43885 type:complete len:169 (-) comp11665_c0_seq4:45-551(-)